MRFFANMEVERERRRRGDKKIRETCSLGENEIGNFMINYLLIRNESPPLLAVNHFKMPTGQEFGQVIAGMACPYAMLSGTSAGRLEC